MDTTFWTALLWIALPFALYFVARIVFAAYFDAKYHSLRRFFKYGESDQSKKRNGV